MNKTQTASSSVHITPETFSTNSIFFKKNGGKNTHPFISGCIDNLYAEQRRTHSNGNRKKQRCNWISPAVCWAHYAHQFLSFHYFNKIYVRLYKEKNRKWFGSALGENLKVSLTIYCTKTQNFARKLHNMLADLDLFTECSWDLARLQSLVSYCFSQFLEIIIEHGIVLHLSWHSIENWNQIA